MEPDQHVDSEAETNIMRPTVPQLQKLANELRQKVASGALPEGNLELAAILGFKPAQHATGRKPTGQGMPVGQLLQLLLDDPNLQVTINVGIPKSR